ncbi:hypothetical protein EI555_017049, partial [Monodon monoceros]
IAASSWGWGLASGRGWGLASGRGWGRTGAGLGWPRGGALSLSAAPPRSVSCSTAEAPLLRRCDGDPKSFLHRPGPGTRTSMKQVSLSWSETAPSSAPGALHETLVIHKDLAEGAEFYNITSLVKPAKDRIREGDSKTSQLRVTHVHRGLQDRVHQADGERSEQLGSSIGSSCNDRGAEQELHDSPDGPSREPGEKATIL